MSQAGFDAAFAEISSWPGYALTPLVSLPKLAQQLGVAEILYKDERGRFGLGSFKALGGAYAVANVVAFGLFGMLFYPYLAHSLLGSSETIGLFLGTAIHDTSQVVGAALTYTIGVGYALNTLRFIAEGYGSVPFEDATKKTTTNPLEALAGVRWAIGHGLHLNGGGGLGIIGDAGTPAFRLLMGVGFQAGEHDAAEDGPAVEPQITEAPKPEDTHPAAIASAAPAAPATEDDDANFAEGGEAEAAVAEGARAAESQALGERRRQESEAAAAAERKRAEEAAAEAERAEARRVAAAEVAADDGEPPPNHGKKRREARPTEEEAAEDAVAAAHDTEEDSPPKKPKKPKAEAEGSGDGVEIREAPEGRVLALGQTSGAGKKGGHKKRPSVYFSETSTTLDRRAEKELEKLAELFERAPKNAKLRLSGHADNLASPEVSLKQSRKRAQAVKAWLVDNGVPAKRIVLEWFGDTAPIGKNKTEAGRSVNRRVDYAFVVFDE
jgi:outer membrane protein OmpA-like peptidoglycan-associated protein